MVNDKTFRVWRVVLAIVFVGTLLGCLPAEAQKKKKGDKLQDAALSESVGQKSDTDQIDKNISEMLAGWQIGDVELMHKYYADDVMVVSGAWEPPVLGWTNYLKAYQSQRERMQSPRMDRQNSFITIRGNVAWATYQWDFSANVDGQPTAARGHTTLVLEKRSGRWLIVQNHTSIVSENRGAAPQPTPPGKPEN